MQHRFNVNERKQLFKYNEYNFSKLSSKNIKIAGCHIQRLL